MNDYTDVFFENISNQQVMVIGDVMLDEYHYCDVDRISPEAPVPVCLVKDTRYVPGAAANVANNIHALGAKVYLLGMYGADGSGQRLCDALKVYGIDDSYLLQSQDHSTTLKSRVVSMNQHILRVDRDMHSKLTQADVSFLKRQIESLLPCVNVIILSDYAKGVLTEEICQFTINRAKEHNKPVVVDPKGVSYTKYRGATVITPNAKEFDLLFGSMNLQNDIESCAQTVCKQAIVDAILLTRSEKGMTLFTQDKSHTIPTEAKEISDVTGAGDTVVAFFSLAFGMGINAFESAKIANVAAGLAVSKFGTSRIPLNEFQDAVSQNQC